MDGLLHTSRAKLMVLLILRLDVNRLRHQGYLVQFLR